MKAILLGLLIPFLGTAARKLAKEHKQRAQSDHDYALHQYEKDMEREALYRDTMR